MLVVGKTSVSGSLPECGIGEGNRRVQTFRLDYLEVVAQARTIRLLKLRILLRKA